MTERATDLPGLLVDAGIRLKRTMSPGSSHKVVCPRCHGGNDKELSLSVTMDEDGRGATWKCHRGSCGHAGGGKIADAEGARRPARAEPERRVVPPPKVDPRDQDRGQGLYVWWEKRGISSETVDRFGLYLAKHWFPEHGGLPQGEHPAIVFPYLVGGKIVNRKYRSSKKMFMQEKDALPSLFNIDAVTSPDRVVWVEGECFPGDAQVLTARGWQELSSLDLFEPVAQWSPGGAIEFVLPDNYIRRGNTEPLVKWTLKGFASVTTAGHNLALADRSGAVWKQQAGTLHRDARHVIPRAGICSGTGVSLTDDQLRLAVAISADASVDRRKNTGPRKGENARYARFALKKQRKIDRLRKILERCGIVASDNPAGREHYQSICFSMPSWLPDKLLPWSWISDLSAEQRMLVLHELVEWDGNRVPNRTMCEFSTKLIEMAEWAQALAHTSGFCSSIVLRSNAYGEWFKVTLLFQKKHTGTQFLQRSDVTHDGDVFCVSVPSGFLVVRQCGHVTISGNCDVLAVYEAGYPQVVSLPNGAPAANVQHDDKRYLPLDTHAELLAKVERFILAGDMDAPGLALREELARRLGRHRCWLVTWPEGCKDANDTLLLHTKPGQTTEAREGALVLGRAEIGMAIEGAEPYPIEGLYNVTADDLQELRRRQKPPTMQTGVGVLDRMIRLPTDGRLMVVLGLPNQGKTPFVRHIAVHTMEKHDRRWAVFSPEMRPWERFAASCAEWLVGKRFYPSAGHDDVGTMTDEELASAAHWLRRRLVMLVNDAERQRPTVDWLLDMAKASVMRHGTTDVWIDPWNELSHLRPAGMREDEYIGDALQRFLAFSTRHGCNFWINVHPVTLRLKPGEKMQPPGPYDIAGGAMFFNKADVMLTVFRPADSPLTQIIVRKAKDYEWGRRGDSVEIAYDVPTGRYSTPVG